MVVSRLIYRMMQGVALSDDDRAVLVGYFRRFASFPEGLVSLGGLQDRSGLLDSDFGRRWQPIFAVRELSPDEGMVFLRDYLQLSRDFRRLPARPGGQVVYSGETITEAHSLLDQVYRLQPGGGQWLLHLSTQGQCLMGGDKAQLLGRRQLVLIGPDYSCDYQRAPDCSRWVHLWLRFSVLPEWLTWCVPLRRSDGLMIVELDEAMMQMAQQAFGDVLSLIEQSASEALMANRIAFLLLLAAEHQEATGAALDERLQRSVDFIVSHYHEAWGVDDLAAHCHLSSARLQALFKGQLGVSPIRWRDQLRVREACRLLLASTRSIADIALDVGYPDQLHFSRRFKQQVGVSPRQYREQGAG